MLRNKFEILTRFATRFACPVLLIAGSLVLATSAQAQIIYEGGGNGSLSDVCGGSTGTLLIATNDGCGNGTTFNALPTAVIIGSAATGAAFQMSNGAATFNGASTTFQNIVTMNGGITVTGGTINMGGNVVQNVADPRAGAVGETDAANRRYVDQQNATQQTQIDSNTTRITNAENVNSTQQTQIGNIQTVNTNQQVQIDQNTTTNNTQAIEIAALQGAVGNLNSTADRLQTQIDQLDRRDDDLAEGIAISLALDQPFFHAGQTFAINLGWGGYDGQNAVGLTAAGIVDRGGLGPTSTTTLHGGIGAGTGQGQVAGKAGLSFGW
ncbi:hypothetical protein [Hyphomicrobium album]|nr:hypothetical protein [Hyphomicrobium album]